MKNGWFIFTFLISCPTLADPSFHCYTAPNSQVQVYEYASSNCAGIDSKEAANKLGGGGLKPVLCMYQAVCKPVEPRLARQEPADMTMTELNNEWSLGKLKSSIVTCAGLGKVEDERLKIADCPSPTKCQSDVFYNFAPVAGLASFEKVNAPSPKNNQEGVN